MVEFENPGFDTTAFLATLAWAKNHSIGAEGCLLFSRRFRGLGFYLQKGSAKVTVVSPTGKEATIALLAVGDFVAKRRSRRWLGCVCPRPLLLPHAPLSESAAER